MDRRYKMVQYMVWAQLVLLAIVAAFVCLTGEDVMWRWDLPFWFLSAGLLLGLLAWPISRGTEKPMVLNGGSGLISCSRWQWHFLFGF